MKELIHFSATWCQPCKQMQPTIDKFLEDNPDISYVKYDADKDVIKFTENNITGVPAFVINIEGQEPKFHKGLATAEKFASLFE